jgi:2-C-methyl-D-erythritol 4-phosphate cytidylyltransferase
LQKYVIIVAGGSGTRMNSVVPKQFLELKGKPVLLHTLQRFIDAIPEIKIVLVLPAAYKSDWESICKKFNFTYPVQLADGGETRFHSVKSGLALVPEGAVVGVHDAARPLVSLTTITTTYQLAEEKGNASPCIPQNESIREVNGDSNKAVDRSKYFIIQNTAMFSIYFIKESISTRLYSRIYR